MKDKKNDFRANLDIKLCDFKMDLIKWQLNIGSCNFGLKSYLWCALVRFGNHAYDFRPNCTQLSSITIINYYFLHGHGTGNIPGLYNFGEKEIKQLY